MGRQLKACAPPDIVAHLPQHVERGPSLLLTSNTKSALIVCDWWGCGCGFAALTEPFLVRPLAGKAAPETSTVVCEI
jgi:hypothetical protein